MIFAKEIMQLKERVAELETENAELKHVEEWKTLTEGINYRRIGTDVELKIQIWKDIELKSWTEKVMRISARTDTEYLWLKAFLL